MGLAVVGLAIGGNWPWENGRRSESQPSSGLRSASGTCGCRLCGESQRPRPQASTASFSTTGTRGRQAERRRQPWCRGQARTADPSRAGPAGQAQTMHLADNSIAADATHRERDLAGGQTLCPKRFELFNAIVRPVRLKSWDRTPRRAAGTLPTFDPSRSRLDPLALVLRNAQSKLLAPGVVG